MASGTENTCRLCLATVLDKNFEAEDDFIKDILDIPLLNLKFEDNSRHMCSTCYERLKSASEFKSMCLNNYKRVISYVDCKKMSHLDLLEFYKDENTAVVSQDHKVCLLCMQLVIVEFRCVQDEELDTIKKLIPEINTGFCKDPIVCASCFDSLYVHMGFIEVCLELNENTGSIYDILVAESLPNVISSNLLIKTENLEEFEMNETKMSDFLTDCVDVDISGSLATENQTGTLSSDSFIKTEDIYQEFQINEMLMPIKPELIQVKSEEDEEASNNLQLGLNYEVIKNVSNGNVDKSETSCQSTSRVITLKCDKCGFETKNKNRLATHYIKHKNTLNPCKTKYKKSLLVCQKRHKDQKTYKCDDCDYESKYKQRYMYHYLAHKNALEVQMMKCNDCSYETRHRKNFLQHMLKHKDTSQIRMHKCDVCSYQSRYKSNLNGHQLRHKRRSEMHMYKCDICNYETKYKANIARHQKIHKTKYKRYRYMCNGDDTSENTYKNKLVSNVLRVTMTQKIRAILNASK